MKRYLSLLFFILGSFVIARPLSAEPAKIHSFKESLHNLDSADEDTLVIFDIDDVLISCIDMALRPAGSVFEPADWDDLSSHELDHLMSIMLLEAKTTLLEPITLELLERLNAQGVKTLALTAARTGKFGVMSSAEDWRIGVLESHGIDLSRSFYPEQLHFFSYFEECESNYSIFKRGILFTGDEAVGKGELLVHFLKKIDWQPKKVIFFDDKMKNVLSVEKALEKEGIPFIGYHYRGVDHLIGDFCHETAQCQFTYLKENEKWLSDREVKEIAQQ